MRLDDIIKSKLHGVHLYAEEKIIVLSIIAYTVILSFFTTMRIYALKASAWDLGNYNQALYTTTFDRKLLYYTADLPANPSGSLFGVHFSPFLLALAPLYFVYPRPETLLVIQSFFIAAGSLPMYRLTLEGLDSKRWGLAFALAYLSSPVMLGVNWFDFHPEAFIPTSMLLVIYYFHYRRWVKFLLCSIFALSIMEHVSVLIAVLSLYFLYNHRRTLYFWKRNRISELRPIIVSSFLLVLSLIWLFISLSIIRMLSPQNPLLFGKTGCWRILGARNILEIPLTVISNPNQAIHALTYDWVTKAIYLLIIFGSFGMLSFLSPTSMALTFPWLIVALFSNNHPYYELGVQYPAFLFPFVVYSAINGAKRLKTMAKHHGFSWASKKGWYLLPSSTFICLVLSNPFAGLNLATYTGSGYGIPSFSSHEQAVAQLVRLIPPKASVFTPNQHVFPLISSRSDAFVSPVSAFMPPGTSFVAKMDELIDKSDYIILDYSRDAAINAMTLSRTEGRYGLLASVDGILLLKRGYIGETVMYEPYKRTFDYRNLKVYKGEVVYDATSQSGYVLIRSENESKGSDFWYGPWILLPPGVYRIDYWLKVGSVTRSDVITLDASVFKSNVTIIPIGSSKDGYHTLFNLTMLESKITFPGIRVSGEDFQPNTYKKFSINITADIFGAYEFRGMNATGKTTLYLDRIVIEQIRPLPYVREIQIQFGNYPPFTYGSHHTSMLYKVINLVPKGSKLMTHSNLAPLSLDKNLSLIPASSPSPIGASFLAQLDYMIEEVDYILLDWKSDMVVTSLVMSRRSMKQNFGIYAWGDGVVLLKHSYNDKPVLFEPLSLIFDHKDLVLLKEVRTVQDPESSSIVPLHSNSPGTDFWYGPYVYLPPGRYEAVFRLKVDQPVKGDVLTIRTYLWPSIIQGKIIWDNETGYQVSFSINQSSVKEELVSKLIKGEDFFTIGKYQEFTMDFSVNVLGVYEFPGMFVKTGANLYLDQIRLVMLEPLVGFNATLVFSTS